MSMSLLSMALAFPGMKFIFKSVLKAQKPQLKKQVMGLTFENPVGLAAGFDKDAKYVDQLDCLGFGFVEIGTLTPKPQPGNSQPRLFRLKKDKALLNRMGFNNGGVEEAVERLKSRKSKIIVGGNIGKNKVTPNEEATRDYLISFETLFNVVDYFVVNVSSPNTPNLRALQDKGPLLELLQTLQEANNKKDSPKPILLKIAPDLNQGQLMDIADIVKQTRLSGVVATNTTIDRDLLPTTKEKALRLGDGGLSGAPLTKPSTEIIKQLRTMLGNEAVIIGVGGIMSPQDAKDKLDAGADLVQVYTGFIYNGPAFVKNINRALAKQPL